MESAVFFSQRSLMRQNLICSPRFVGRQWIIDRVNTWFADQPQIRVLRIEGRPGLGKTAVASYFFRLFERYMA